MAESTKLRKVNKREMLVLISMKLRDPSTDADTFVSLMRTWVKLAPWKRAPRKPKTEDVSSMVEQMEAEMRRKKSSEKEKEELQ